MENSVTQPNIENQHPGFTLYFPPDDSGVYGGGGGRDESTTHR